jgi:protein involved in polysaccharide export with SLBB domain
MTKRLFLFLALVITTVLSAQDLSGIKVDDLSDAQIRSILAQGQARGFEPTEGEALAMSMGLPAAEAAKFRQRVERLNGQSRPNDATGTLGADVLEVPGTVASTETLGNTANVESQVLEQAEIMSEASVAIAGTEETVVAPGDGEPVRIYGQQLFRGGNLRIYERSLDAKAPDHYILGTGDEIGVSVYGTAYFNEVYKVDDRGYIAINRVGNVAVRGLTFAEARNVIKGKMAPYFNLASNTFAFNLAYSRTVTINIVGEVLNPGSYKLPAINTAFNALMAAGGPSDIGTLRDIKVIRGGKVIKTLDVYAFLMNPSADNDFYLQENDFISVGTYHSIVTISGAVKRPMRYELLPEETLEEALAFAGGYSAQAFTDQIQIKRFGKDESILLEVASDYDAFTMLPLDEVTVRTKNDELKQVVSVNGVVQLPGAYSFTPGMRITDLILKAGGVPTDSLRVIDRAWLVRVRPDFTRYYVPVNIQEVLKNSAHADNFDLKPKDVLTIRYVQDYSDEEMVSIGGAVRDGFEMKYAEGLNVKNMLEMAGGLTPYADVSRAFIIRTDTNYQREIVELNLPGLLSDSSEYNLSLLPRDEVRILSKIDRRAEEMVSINGAVRNPLEIMWAEGLKVSDLVELSGGVRFETFDGKLYVRRTNEDLTTQILTVNLAAILENSTSVENILLEPRDILTVLEKPNVNAGLVVTVQGEVRNPLQFPYSEGMTLGEALRLAGGITLKADYTRVEVSRLSVFSDLKRGALKDDIRSTAIIAQLPREFSRDLNATSEDMDFVLQPYDQIMVREIPEFQLQEFVYIGGEVKYPGYYVLETKEDRLRTIIRRAGGVTRYADRGNVSMSRPGYPNVVLNFKRAMFWSRSTYNYVLEPGDAISVPRTRSLIAITGPGHAHFQETLESTINSPWTKYRRAGHYVRKYAGGFASDAKRSKTYVSYPNGKISRTVNLYVAQVYPKVKKGGTIHTGLKDPEIIERKLARIKRDPVDWQTVINDVVGQVSTAVTSLGYFYVLVTR